MSLDPVEASAARDYVHKFDGQPLIRIAILGADGVGKRSFQRRLQWNQFLGDVYDPTESELFHMRIEGGDKLVYYDGEMLAPPYSATDYPKGYLSDYWRLRHVEALVLMYDVGDRASLEEMKRYFENFTLERTLQARVPCTLKCSPICEARPTPYRGLLLVIANKTDRCRDEWEVGAGAGEAFAARIGAAFSAVSVRSGEGCGSEMLHDMTMQILSRRVRAISQGEEERLQTTYESRLEAHRKNGRFWY